MAVEYIGRNSPDGMCIGLSSSEKVAFYGGTPVTRPSVTWPNTGTATTTLNETKVNGLIAALVSLNLIVTT